MSGFSHGPMKGLLSDLDTRNKWTLLAGRESLIAGAGAGLISSVVTCPLDVVKTRLQARGGIKVAAGSSNAQMEGLVGTLRGIWRLEGIRGLYRGLAPTIYGYLPTWAIYFTVYDSVKASLLKKRGVPEGQQDAVVHMIAAMSGGATGTILTNPLWVIKTRFMTQALEPDQKRYRHTLDAVRQIYGTEGLRAFYKGLVPSLFGVTHVAVQFPLYEKFKSLYRRADGEEIPSYQILLCSSSSKAIASVTTYPHEVVRTRLQIQRHSGKGLGVTSKTRGVADTIRLIAREEGFRGFYRGLGVNLIRTVPSSALTILTYELLMRNLHALTRAPPRRLPQVDAEKAEE